MERPLVNVQQPTIDRHPKIITIYGRTLTAIGHGKYPYDCRLKDEYPTAMIYQGDGGWCSEFDDCFLNRDKSLDVFA